MAHSAGATVTRTELVIAVDQPISLFGVNVQIPKDGLKGWYAGGGIRKNAPEKTGAHGNLRARGWRGSRIVSVEGEYWAATRREAAEATDLLASCMADGDYGRLTVVDPDQGARYGDCTLYGTPQVDWSENDGGTFALDFELDDPRKYSIARSEGTTGIAKPGGGLEFPLFRRGNNVMTFGRRGTSGTVTLTNDGTAETETEFVVFGGGAPAGVTITEVETQRRIVYGDPIPPASTLAFDGASGSVTLDGVADRSGGLVRAQWFTLPPKTSRTYLLEAVGGPDVYMTAGARPAWW